MRYNFDWDPNKEKANLRKHSLSFRQATTVFRDPNQLSTFDEEHSENEERWITIGVNSSGVLRVVIHTLQVHPGVYDIRIISARKATRKETNQYKEGTNQ